ncbi:hypothetical protein M0R45_027120 [Rubus argutus]|uniref:Pentatricopeptide repeat-containing protein n=1 Tax=Rubus argutus TaxID=59490 RepID=A0AAW1X162_RUBAR
MPKRDVVSWTIMVGGYAYFCEESVKLFQQLVQGGETEPEATVVNVLSACSSSCALTLGRQVHSYVSTQQDLRVNGKVGNALINMFVKCGNSGMAISVFKALDCKDIIKLHGHEWPWHARVAALFQYASQWGVS